MIKSNSFNSKSAASSLSNSFTSGTCMVTPLGHHEFETRLLKTKSTLSKSSSVRNMVRLENGGATMASKAATAVALNRSNQNVYSSCNHSPRSINFAPSFHIKTNASYSPPSSSASSARSFRNKPPPPPSPNTASYIYSIQRPLLYTTKPARFRAPSNPASLARLTENNTDVNNNRHTSGTRQRNANSASSTDEDNKNDENLIYSRQGSVRGNLNKVKNSVKHVFQDDSSSISSSLSVTNSSQFNYSSTSTCSNSSSSSSSTSSESGRCVPVLNSIQLNNVNNSPKSGVSAGSVKTYSNLLLVSLFLLLS
jgi:hypothetical protein